MTLSPACAADPADTADFCTYCGTDNPAVVEVYWSRSESAPDVLTDCWRAGDCCRAEVEAIAEDDFWRVSKVRVDPIDPQPSPAELESRARAVADTHTIAQVRAQLAVLGPFDADPVEVAVWRRALVLLDLCDEPEVHATAGSLRGFPELLEVLCSVDDGRIDYYASTEQGPLYIDRGDDEHSRQVCDAGVVDALADLRFDGLVERHLLVTSALGFAVRRVAARAGAVAAVSGDDPRVDLLAEAMEPNCDLFARDDPAAVDARASARDLLSRLDAAVPARHSDRAALVEAFEAAEVITADAEQGLWVTPVRNEAERMAQVVLGVLGARTQDPELLLPWVDQQGERWACIPYVPGFGMNVWMSPNEPIVFHTRADLERMRGELTPAPARSEGDGDEGRQT